MNKAPGPDNFSPFILKQLKNQLVLPLTIVFNKSLKEGSVPGSWKEANITPIFKKGSKYNPGNYRPISLTSVPVKILETIIKRAVVDHLETNNLIYDTQHGFRRGKSCLTNLFEYMEYVTKEVDNKNAVDVIYLDFSKAFDKVPHKRLLAKIQGIGIGSNLLKWVESWLTDRKQRVVLNGSSSSWENITSGVPQGSVLGPLLFLIYVNDMDVDIKSEISKFADDTKVFSKATSSTQCSQLQATLDSLVQWSET